MQSFHGRKTWKEGEIQWGEAEHLVYQLQLRDVGKLRKSKACVEFGCVPRACLAVLEHYLERAVRVVHIIVHLEASFQKSDRQTSSAVGLKIAPRYLSD